MNRFLVFAVLAIAAFATAAWGDNDGARSFTLAPEISRSPQQVDGGGIAFQVKNIQVEAEWDVMAGDAGLTIDDNGVLTWPSDIGARTVVVTVIVEDNFSKLNDDYVNLAASATITINFIALDPKIFIAGGRVSNTDNSNDGVWSSTDGKNWQQCNVGNSKYFTSRYLHAMAVKGRLYVFGGRVGDRTIFEDIWSTVDCTTWQQVTGSADWPERYSFPVAVLQNTFFLAGGASIYSDVWSSTNGKNWVELKSNFVPGEDIIGWIPRSSHRMVSYKGTLYITGGYSNSPIKDVWSSVDGTTWSLETDSPPWAGRYDHGFVVHNNLLYLMGGLGTSRLSDVWSSENGKDWTQASTGSIMGGGSRSNFSTVSYKGRLYIMGGIDSSNNVKNDVWSWADGETWSLETPDAGWSVRSDHTAAVFPRE